MTRTSTALAAALALAAAVSAALAQAPQRTTATYGDWTMRCELRDGPPPSKQCEMVQTATAQGQANPISQVAIGRATKTEPFKIVIQLPLNVWIPSGVHYVIDPKGPGVTAPFKRCVPVGCFADFNMTDDLMKQMKAQTGQGRYEFKDAAERVVTIPISFKGFGIAYDALLKE